MCHWPSWVIALEMNGNEHHTCTTWHHLLWGAVVGLVQIIVFTHQLHIVQLHCTQAMNMHTLPISEHGRAVLARCAEGQLRQSRSPGSEANNPSMLGSASPVHLSEKWLMGGPLLLLFIFLILENVNNWWPKDGSLWLLSNTFLYSLKAEYSPLSLHWAFIQTSKEEEGSSLAVASTARLSQPCLPWFLDRNVQGCLANNPMWLPYSLLIVQALLVTYWYFILFQNCILFCSQTRQCWNRAVEGKVFEDWDEMQKQESGKSSYYCLLI